MKSRQHLEVKQDTRDERLREEPAPRDERLREEPTHKVTPLVPPAPPGHRTTRVWVTLVAVLVVAAIAAGVYWRLHNARQMQAAGGRGFASGPQTVGVASVSVGSIPIVFNALGTVTPLATVTIKTQVSGYLTEIAFKEGQMVKKGDFLAQIDPRPYQVLLEQNQAQLAKDKAALDDAQVNLQRYQTLFSQDSIAKQTLDTQRSTVNQNLAAIQLDQAMIDTQRLNLTYCHIVAPVAGRVGLRQVDMGNYVTPADANGLVVITQLQPISVLFNLPEDNLPTVLKRVAMGAHLPAQAFDRTNSTKLADGVLETLDNQVDPTTGTVKLRATFSNAEGILFPQQFVNIHLLVDTVQDAFVIPNSAVQRGSPGTFVYLIGPERTIAVRPIKIGPADDKFTSVLSGLSVDEQVVVDGTDRLREGDKVVWAGPGGGLAEALSGAGGHGGRPGGAGTPASAADAPGGAGAWAGHHRGQGAPDANGNSGPNAQGESQGGSPSSRREGMRRGAPGNGPAGDNEAAPAGRGPNSSKPE
jgi:membrane fusion protein, multidrug efflux system